MKEIHSGFGTESFGVQVSVPNPDRCKQIKNFKRWMEDVERKGVDFNTQIIEISPHAHAFNGGIKIDEHANTGIPRLYAAGEIAAGPHGADRLGGNMMTATQVLENVPVAALGSPLSGVRETSLPVIQFRNP